MKKLVKCPYCSKSYSKKGIGTHIWRSHGNGKNHDPNIGYKNNTRKIWNKGLTKENDTRVAKYGETFSQKIKDGFNVPSFKGKKHSSETKKKLQNNGGYRNGSGRGKNGRYKGYWCDSSWELAFVIYNLEHNISFKRNTEKFKYKLNNKTYNYIPDFIMDDGTYIEIKGYDNGTLQSKLSFFPHTIKVLFYNDIKYILDYVIKKYGKDFIKLYDNHICTHSSTD